MADYYASASASAGQPGTLGSPFRPVDFTNSALATGGNTLWLLDGVYQGANFMINPDFDRKGTSQSDKVWVKAVNEGEVLIDGQNVRTPIYLDYTNNHHYWQIEGINFKDGINWSVRSSGTGNYFRRCIAWGGLESTEGQQTWHTNGYSGLVEDCASFGGRYTMGANQMTTNAPNPRTTFRRCFTIFTGATITSPKASFLYWYNSDPLLAENCIATWDNSTVSNGQGIIFAAAADNVSPYHHGGQTELFGCIAYLKASQGAVASMSAISAQENRKITFTNCVGYIDPLKLTVGTLALDMRAHNVSDCPNHAGASHGTLNMNLTNVTGIGGTSPANVHGDWTQSNVNVAASVALAYPGSNTLYVNDGTVGATVCKRYVDGTLTGDGLWPWPMNQRIKDACGDAGITVVDVTADMEAIFGTIPAACIYSASTPFVRGGYCGQGF